MVQRAAPGQPALSGPQGARVLRGRRERRGTPEAQEGPDKRAVQAGRGKRAPPVPLELPEAQGLRGRLVLPVLLAQQVQRARKVIPEGLEELELPVERVVQGELVRPGRLVELEGPELREVLESGGTR
jgi:hypothetical protein